MIRNQLKELRNDGSDPRKNDIWRILIFSFTDATSAAITHMIGYWIYYTQNVLKLGIFLGLVVMPMVLLDAVTDPLIASFFDRFESKYGKFKPIMAIGTALTVIPGIVIFTYPVNSILPQWLDFTILILMYAAIIIGSTTLKTTSRAGQAIITQDPRQRPLFAMGQAIFVGAIMIVITLVLTSDLIGKMQDTMVWRVAILIVSSIAITLIFFAIKAISTRDNPTYYKIGDVQKINILEFFRIIKRSKPLQMLLVAAASDAFAAGIRAGLTIYLFANIIQMRSLFSIFDITSSIVLGIPILFIGVYFASKDGSARIFTRVASAQSILTLIGFASCIILLPMNPDYVYTGFNLNVLIILLIFGLYISSLGISNSLITPMAGDLADYEYVQTGKFVPSLIGAAITTTEKIAQSVKGLVIVGIMAYCGFTGTGSNAVVPDNQFVNARFYYAVLTSIFVLPAIGHFVTVLAMKNYPLTDEKMQEVSQVLLKDRGLE